ncbi:MAG: glutathione S-transferase family protein [Alphaproteobacteria bacterium]|jgi:glutathione S-transferase|nr:glutathione S-transferase family protein [Alphaproteobacteria bacterium]
MTDLRIFSYLPNPRLWKATIAARLGGVDLDLRGAKPGELQDWLWDFDARPLTAADRRSPENTARQARTGFTGELHKTAAFLETQPFATVPAAFSPDGTTGIFESNSIMRAVARVGGDRAALYGADPYTASRIDSFLDASLVFARDGQIYLLALRAGDLTPEIHERVAGAFATYMSGIEAALAGDRAFLVGDALTLADICFVAEIALFSRERVYGAQLEAQDLDPIHNDDLAATYPGAVAHYARLCAHDAFAPDVAPYLRRLDDEIARGRRPRQAVGH